MDFCDCKVIPTEKQLQLLQGPKTIESLLAADFLGKQDYINEWIMDWTQKNDYSELPLCVSESIITDKKIPSVILKKVFFWYPILNMIIEEKIVINVK